LPLCRAIKEKFPDKNLSIVASSYLTPLLDKIDIQDKTFYVEDYENGIGEIFRNEKFHTVFFPHPVFDEATAGFLQKIPLRIGSGYRIYQLLYNFRLYEHRKESKYHEAEYNNRMLMHITGEMPEVKLVKPRIGDKTREGIMKMLEFFKIRENDRIIIIHPGSGGSAYDWDPVKFGRAAKAVAESTGVKVIITGSKNETEKCKIVNNHCPEAVNLCGSLGLDEMMALIERSSLLAANSTGIIHIAASLDVPVIGLYPNTPYISARRWGPWTNKKIILSPKINGAEQGDNMDNISVNDFVNAAKQLLNM
jgi:ADP-heptose:LPS heptosyltransferase